MKLRTKCLPRTSVDICSFLFIILIVPFGYCFEMLYVLPTLHPATSFWYVLHAFLGSFVFVNIASNFVFIMITDTSVSREVTPSKGMSPRWSFCTKCELHIPPRAWHCSDCDCCILKRDHHCQFTGCCIGHRNQRYFFFFLLYMAIGTAYGLYLHTCFIYQCASEYLSVSRQYHKSFVLALARSLSYSVHNCFVLFYGVTFFGMGAAVCFLYYHATTMAKGMVLHERSHDIHEYDSGSVRKNVTQVLGERWYLAWISPLVGSELPSDGVKWAKTPTNKRVI